MTEYPKKGGVFFDCGKQGRAAQKTGMAIGPCLFSVQKYYASEELSETATAITSVPLDVVSVPLEVSPPPEEPSEPEDDSPLPEADSELAESDLEVSGSDVSGGGV